MIFIGHIECDVAAGCCGSIPAVGCCFIVIGRSDPCPVIGRSVPVKGLSKGGPLSRSGVNKSEATVDIESLCLASEAGVPWNQGSVLELDPGRPKE
jgi:hypothetical protein